MLRLYVFVFPQTGVHDYETFSEQLDSLGRWIVEAEEGLKVQDPNGSTDLSLIQDRMGDLKVNVSLMYTLLLSVTCYWILGVCKKIDSFNYRDS